MKTIMREPYAHNVVTLKGGKGYDEIYEFYKNHFIGKIP
jgi:carboxymethylenebutenolidase